MLRPILISPPVEDVVTLASLKQHLRIDHTDEDVLLEAMLASAIESLDGPAGDLNIAMVTQSWKVHLSCWPDIIRLPLHPVSAITSIKFRDTNNAQQTWPSSNYTLHSDALGSFIRYGYNVQPPSLYIDRLDNVEVEFVAGYGGADQVPAPLKAAILLLAADLYENRGSFVTGTIVTQIPLFIRRLTSRYNRVGA